MTVLTPKVPAGMVDLMKSLSKSVLKEKPENIYEYAAAYFENMLKKRDGSLDKGYGKFRSYQKYCAFVEKMQVRQLKMDKQNDETDSGVGSSNTDDETTKTACEEAVASSSSAPKMAVNGVAIQASKRNPPKPPVQQKKTKNYSVNPKLKAQGSIERDRKGRAEAKDAAATKKSKAKPRKLSSKKPSENLIVIKEETSADVAEVDEIVKMSSAAAKIQRAFRKYQSDKEMERVNVVPAVKNTGMNENMAAVIIQRLFKSVLGRKRNLTEKLQKENMTISNDADFIALKEDDQLDPIAVTETTLKHQEIEFLVDAENDKERSINEVVATKNSGTLDQANDSNDEKKTNDVILTQTLQDSTATNLTIHNEDTVNKVTNANHSDNKIEVEETNLDQNVTAKKKIKDSSPEQQPIPLHEFAKEDVLQNDYIQNIKKMDHNSQPHADEFKDDNANEENRNEKNANEKNELLIDNIQKIEKIDHHSQPVDEFKDENEGEEIGNEEIELLTGNIQNIEKMDHNSKPHADQFKDDNANEENGNEKNANEKNELLIDNIQNIEKMDHISQMHASTDPENGMAKTVQTSAESIEVKPTGKELDKVVDILETNLDNEQLDLTAAIASPIDQPTEYELAETVILDQNDDVHVYVLNSELAENSEAKDSVEQISDQTVDIKDASFEEVGLKLIPSHIIENPINGKYVESTVTISKVDISNVQSENSKLDEITGQNIFEIEDEVKDDLMKVPTNAIDKQTAGNDKEDIDGNQIESLEMESNKVQIETDIIDTNDSVSIIQETIENETTSKTQHTSAENLGMHTSTIETEMKELEQIKSEKLSETLDFNNKIVAVEEITSIDKEETFDSAPIQFGGEQITQDDLQNISGYVTETVVPLATKQTDVPDTNKDSENSNVKDEAALNIRSKRELKVEDNQVDSDDLVDYSEDKATGEPNIKSDNLNTDNVIVSAVGESNINNDDLNIIEPITHSEHIKEVMKTNSVDKFVPSEDINAEEPNIKSDNLNADNAIVSAVGESNIKSDDLNIIEPITHTEHIKDKFDPSAPAESPIMQKEDEIYENSKIEQNVEKNSEKLLESNMLDTESAGPITNNEIDQTVDLKNEVVLKIPENKIESNSEIIDITELDRHVNDIDLTKQYDGISNVTEVAAPTTDQNLPLQNEDKSVNSSEVLDKTYIIETGQDFNDEVSTNIQSPTNDIEENSSVVPTLNDPLENVGLFTKPNKSEAEMSKSLNGTNDEEIETIPIDKNTIGMEVVGEIFIKDLENQMVFVETVAVGNEITEEAGVAGDLIDEQIIEKNAIKQIVEKEKVAGEMNEQDTKDQIIEKDTVSGEIAVELLEKVPENHEIEVEAESNSHLEVLLPKESTDVPFNDNIDSNASAHEKLNYSVTPKTEESVNELQMSSNKAIYQNSDLLVIGNEMIDSNLYAKLEALEVCSEPLPNPADKSKTTAFGEYVNQTDDKSLINSNQILLSNHDATVDIIKEEEDSEDWTDTENPNESGNTTVRDWFNDKEKQTTATDVQYELLSSDLSGTEEKNPEQFKESGVDETSRDELDDLSEVENFDLSSCGEDSLEAMYYSLRKNEIMVDKMHRRASEQRGVSEFDPEVEDKNEENYPKIPFPTKITEHLNSAMNEVLGSGKSDKINTSVGSDSDDVIVGKMNDGYTESTTNLSSTDSEAEPIQLTIESPIKTIPKLIDDDEFMDPMNYAMQQKDELLQRMHGTWFQETINKSNESDQYNEDLDEFPDNPNYASSASNQRKMWTTSVSEADSDYMESAGNRRLTKDDFNISTAFDHLTSTDSDSTIVSAATKIQAGARGFLTRRRLRRSSMGTTLSPDNTHCSFGNAAIDKSLEDLIEQQEIISQDDAAIKIQHSYRRYRNKKLRMLKDQNTLDTQSGDSQYDIEQYSIDYGGDEDIQHGIIEIKCEQKKIEQLEHDGTRDVLSPHGLPREAEERYENIIISNEYVEQQRQLDDADSPKINANDARHQQKYQQLSTATGHTDVLDTAQRRQTLQRGDAVQRHSTPEEIEALLQQQNQPKTPVSNVTAEQEASEINLETGERAAVIRSSSLNTTKRAVSIRRLGQRQKSMPVQIDTEIMRMIPKHLRKRIKSADSMKKRSN